MSTGTFVIVNHSAARARAAWVEVRHALRSAGISFDAHEAHEFGDARTSARDALAAGHRTIAVVGGDGTLSEVVNGFFATEGEADRSRSEVDDASQLDAIKFADARAINPGAALALLPAGTGNDFARSLEGQRASLPHWIARLIAHCRADADARSERVGDAGAAEEIGRAEETTRRVDVLRGSVDDGARSFFCLNAVTLGIGAQVAARVAAQGRFTRKLSGEARFALAALPALARWRERRVRVRVDGGEARELKTNLIAAVNSRFAGGGMMFSPVARVDDGLLDVVTASRLSRAMLAREMMRVHAGGHVANPRVSIVRAARVSIEPVNDGDALPVEADGDVRGVTPLTLSVIPRALRVVV
jgi:diacylglycerol kinase family enzyme